MNLKNKKGQVSLEILAILGVVVLGAIIAGVYYINSINENVSQSNELGDLSDNFDDAFEDINESGVSGNGGIEEYNPENCGDGYCSEGEDVINCPQDCGGYFGGISHINTENTYIKDQAYDISILANTNFKDNYIDSVEIKRFFATENNFLTVDNSYYSISQGTYNSTDGNYSNFGEDGYFKTYVDDENYSTTLNFRFKQEGQYKIYAIGKNDLDINVSNFVVSESDPFTVISNPNEEPLSITILSPSEDEIYTENSNIILDTHAEGLNADQANCIWKGKLLSDPFYPDNTGESILSQTTDLENTFYFGGKSAGETILIGDSNIISSLGTDGWFTILDCPCNSDSLTFLNITDEFYDNYGPIRLKVIAVENIEGQTDENTVDIFYKDPAQNWMYYFNPNGSQYFDFNSILTIKYLGDTTNLTPQDLDVNIGYDPTNLNVEYTTDDGQGGGNYFNSKNKENVFYFGASDPNPLNTNTGNYNLNEDYEAYFNVSADNPGTYSLEINTNNEINNIQTTHNVNYEFFDMTALQSEVIICNEDDYCSADPTEFIFYVGDTVELINNASGGSTNYSYRWLEDGSVVDMGSTYTRVLSSQDVGTLTITAKLTDDYTGNHIEKEVPLTVYYSPFEVNITNPNSGDYYNSNEVIELNSEIDISNVSCTWYLDDFETIISTNCNGDNYQIENNTAENLSKKFILVAQNTNTDVMIADVSNPVYIRPKSSNVDNVEIISQNRYRLLSTTPDEIELTAQVEDTSGDKTVPISGCDWYINGNFYTDSHNCNISLDPPVLELDLGVSLTEPGIYTVMVQYNEPGTIYTYGDVNKLYFAECFVDTDSSCPYNGNCILDEQVDEGDYIIGKCNWLYPELGTAPLSSFIEITDVDLHVKTYSKYFAPVSVFGNDSISFKNSFDGSLDGGDNSVDAAFYSGFSLTSADNEYPEVYSWHYGVTDGEIDYSQKSRIEYSNDHSHGLVSFANQTLKNYATDLYPSVDNEHAGVLATYITAPQPAGDIEDINISIAYDYFGVLGVSGGPWSTNLEDIENPVQDASDQTGLDLCEVIGTGAAVLNLDSEETNKILVPVYYDCSDDYLDDFATIGMYSGDVGGNFNSLSVDNWNFIMPDQFKNGEYTYDYPAISTKGDTLVMMGVRYPTNDFNTIEWYVYYTRDGGNNWTLETYLPDGNLFPAPIFTRGNTLMIDSDDVAHYAYPSAVMIKSGYNEGFTPINGFGSTPSEMKFDLDTSEFIYKSVFPNPGYNNDFKDAATGRITINNSLVHNRDAGTNIQGDNYPLSETLGDAQTALFSLYEQQAINLDNNWMAQTWVSWELSEEDNLGFVTGNSRVFNIALSNDNGEHWTAPIVICEEDSDMWDMFTDDSQQDFMNKHLRMLNNIIEIGSGKGLIVLQFFVDYGDYYPSGENFGGRYYSKLLEIDFSRLQTTENEEEVTDFIDEYSGNILYDQGINYSQIREYINNETIEDHCTLFHNESYNGTDGIVSSSDLKDCRIQIEPKLDVFAPEIRDISFVPDMPDHITGDNGALCPDSPFTCFNKGTKVYTPSGYKNIEQLSSGDIVYSLDENTELVKTEVIKLLAHTTKPIYGSAEIILENNKKIYTTFNHAFYNPIAKKYSQLRLFKEGDYLYTYNEDSKEFENVKIRSINKTKDAEETYNLSLKKPHNYLAEGIVVHNLLKGEDSEGYNFLTDANLYGDYFSDELPIHCVTINTPEGFSAKCS